MWGREGMGGERFSPPEGFTGVVLEAQSLAERTTLRMGGPVRWLIQPDDKKSLGLVMKALTRDTPGLALGGGSNLLVADEGFDGIMLDLTAKMNDIQKVAETGEGVTLQVGAGTATRALAHYARRNGLSGLEFLAGIPGSVGGAVKMNAGAYGGEMVQRLVSVQLVDVHGRLLEQDPAALAFGYRHSAIGQGEVVVSVWLELQKDDPEKIRQRIREMHHKRRQSQPLRYPSAGSVFKNPPQGPAAWKLIDEVGMRGVREGDAQVSSKHTNFFINRGRARTRDMLRLMERVRERVFKQFAVQLELELRLLGRRGMVRDW